jgi:hypothetical protein
MALSDASQHLSYDADKGVWEFKVNHFTRWGDSDDDEDEKEPEQPAPAEHKP